MLNQNLKNIFSIFNQNQINYLVLRNYFPIEELNHSADIDLFIMPKDFYQARKLLKKLGWQKRLIPRNDFGHEEWFKFDKMENKIFHLDLQNYLKVFSQYLRKKQLAMIFYSAIKLDNTFFVPSSTVALILLLSRVTFEKEKIEPKNLISLKNLWPQVKLVKNYQNEIKEIFGEQASLAVSKLNDSKIIDYNFYQNLKINFSNNFKFKEFFLGYYQKMKLIFYKILMIFRPIKLIVFLGVDGSGKSTLISYLAEFSPIFRAKLYLGWNNYFFPFLEKLDKPKKNKLAAKISFFLFHLILPFDYFGRYLKAKITAKYGFLVADRYPLPKRESDQNNLSGRFRAFSLLLTYLLLPGPNILFILGGDPNLIWQRKKEGSYDKFLAEYQRCLEAAKIFSCEKTIIDTTKTFDQTFNQINSFLFSVFVI